MGTPPTQTTLLDILRCPDHSELAERWNEFARLYSDSVVRWARRFGVHNDAADVAQEVMLRLRNGALLSYQPGGEIPFRNWLKVMVRRACAEYFRTRGNSPLPSMAGVPEAENIALQDDFDDAEEAEYRLGLIRQALASIRPGFEDQVWAAFWRTAIDGQPTQQVAADLQMNPNAIYQARYRVLARLREFIAFNFAGEIATDFA